MNLSQLRELAVMYLDDPDQGYFTPTILNRFLNNAQRKVQRILIDMKQNFYLKCVEAPTVANQCNLALPDDFMMVNRIEMIISGTYPNENKQTLQPITLNQQDLLGPTPSTPACYYFKKNNLCFAPIPDNIYTIRMVYSYQVSDMTNDNSVPDIPERYHELLSIYAAMDGFIKDDRDNGYLVQIAQSYIENMKAEAQARQEQVSRQVVTMDDDYGWIF